MTNPIWVLIIEAPANPGAIPYWQRWFASKSIQCETRENAKGTSLYRAMTRDEYANFSKITVAIPESVG